MIAKAVAVAASGSDDAHAQQQQGTVEPAIEDEDEDAGLLDVGDRFLDKMATFGSLIRSA